MLYQPSTRSRAIPNYMTNSPSRSLRLAICRTVYMCPLFACDCLQVRKPARDLPLGIMGALGIVTVCYMLMSAALVMMVDLSFLQSEDGAKAPFAAAFR